MITFGIPFRKFENYYNYLHKYICSIDVVIFCAGGFSLLRIRELYKSDISNISTQSQNQSTKIEETILIPTVDIRTIGINYKIYTFYP